MLYTAQLESENPFFLFFFLLQNFAIFYACMYSMFMHVYTSFSMIFMYKHACIVYICTYVLYNVYLCMTSLFAKKSTQINKLFHYVIFKNKTLQIFDQSQKLFKQGAESKDALVKN